MINILDAEYCKPYQVHPNKLNKLINYWPINGNAKDIIGGADMNGLVNATFTADRNGKENSAIRFQNGYAQVPPGVYFYGEFSIMMWIKFIKTDTVISWPRVLDFGNGASNNNILFSYSAATQMQPELHMYVYNTPHTFNINNPFEIDKWMHVAITKSSTELKGYLNGKLVQIFASNVLPINVIRNSNFIGKSNWAGNSLAYAEMDDLKIFNISLTDDDIMNNYLL
jgi:hypothetical protein